MYVFAALIRNVCLDLFGHLYWGLLPPTSSPKTMTSRLRHRPQTEEEDAAALKLGPGE